MDFVISKSRHVGFFPALPLARNLELGEWIAGTPPPETLWAPGRFRELSETLIRSFEKRGFKGGALLWHRERGFDGSLPSDEEITAIRAAVTFAVLDANDRLEGDLNKGHYLATTENADLFLQPVDEEDGGVTHVRGGALKRTLVGGLKIGGEPPPLPDAVEPISGTVPASAKLAAAVFAAVRSGSGVGPAVATAAEWHRLALANPAAVTTHERLVALKTGFEALLHESRSHKCARLLRGLFEGATAAHRDLLPWRGMLWSPTERTDLMRTWETPAGKKGTEQRTEIEDWFMALADARNDIIHSGVLRSGVYAAPPERPLSRYAGTLFWVGERILREAIKATVGAEVLLCGALARRAFGEAMFGDYVRELRNHAQGSRDQQAPAPAVEPAAPEDPPRPIGEILAWLACPSANHVTLSKLGGGGGATLELAREMANRNANKWSAEVPGKSMLISRAEYEALRRAGAEDALPDFWDSCE